MSHKEEQKEKNQEPMTDDPKVDQMVEEQEQPVTGTEEPVESAEGAVAEEPSLQEQIEQMKKDNQELKDKYLRLFAEFDNYKKRTVREKLDLMSTAAADTLAALLPVLDDFDRAKKAAEAEGSVEPLSEGVQLVYNKLYSVLRAKGLEPMDTIGQVFDPEFHEAFTEIPAPSEELKGKIVDTIEKGYKLNDKIIRHAKVVIGK